MDFFVFLMIAVGIFAAIAASNGRNAAAWGAAARVLGVTFVKKNAFSNPRLSGPIEGFDLDVSVKSSGNAKTTRYVVSYPALGVGLDISRKGGFAKISDLFGGGGEESDGPFEQLASIKTSDPQRLSMMLTPQVRDAITDLLTDLPAAKVKDDKITFERRNIERNVNTIVTTSRQLVVAAHAITGRRSVQRTEERAPLPPDPYAPEARMPTMPPPPPTPPASDPTAPPSDPMSTLDTALPSYDTTPSSLDPGTMAEPLMPSYDEPSTAPPPTEAETPASQQPAGQLDLMTIAGALFGGSMLSFQAATTFDEQYFGRKVRWTGTVTKRTDTLVQANVGTIDTTLFGPIQVGAIVETRAPVKEGDQVVVEGTLSSIDFLERAFAVDGTVKRA